MKPASMRRVFLGAALIIAIAWAMFYIYFMRLDCPQQAQAGDCDILLPWQLRGGPFYLLTGLPASVLLTLVVLAWLTGRVPKAQAKRD